MIGIYPETKHPSYFRSIGLALEPPLVKALAAHGFVGPKDPVFIQSFEVQNLKDLQQADRGEARFNSWRTNGTAPTTSSRPAIGGPTAT